MTIVIVKRRGNFLSSVRQRMIERTVVLLAKKGLQGASFSQVLEESGAPRGSLYHHFPGGKDELVLAAIDAAAQYALAAIEQQAGKPAAVVAEAFIDLWRQVLAKSDFGAGCAIAAVTVAAETPALRDRVGEAFRHWRVRLGELLELGGVAKGGGSALAASLISACEGAVILSRGERSMDVFELVAAQQLAAVKQATASRRK
jgi:TetR/AcrR family transcriptional regulator, lmrAB and yxaGH operons repressor